MKKILIIGGPTATGKTELAIGLAKKFSGEIISADSRQIYCGMDIGTGKDPPRDVKLKMKNEKLQIKIKSDQILKPYRFSEISVWLLDIVEPDKVFNVADYCELARKVMEDIWQRGKLPLLVGGTGFYIKAVIDGVESLGIAADWELREKLASYPIIKLSNYLKRINPGRWKKMNESDRRNPRRLIRAIEIAIKVKSDPFGKTQGHPEQGRMDEKLKVKSYSSKFNLRPELRSREVKNCLFIGLTAPYKVLYQRIDERVEKRLKEGVVREIKGLLKKGYGWDLPAMSGMGHREFKDFFEKKATLDEAIQRWKFDEHGYARRQMTWFKKDPRIHWFNITESGWEREVEELLRRWYTL